MTLFYPLLFESRLYDTFTLAISSLNTHEEDTFILLREPYCNNKRPSCTLRNTRGKLKHNVALKYLLNTVQRNYF
jgi:hypothetical protein